MLRVLAVFGLLISTDVASAQSAFTSSDIKTVQQPEATVDISPDQKMYPIALTCPRRAGNGTLELLSKNKRGFRGRIQVVYENHVKTVVRSAAARKDEDFQVYRSVNLLTETNPELLHIAEKTTKRIDEVKERICEGDKAARNWYFKLLKGNETYLRRYSD